ncbi:MAG: GNAT family N-acetyltransferase [Candidatus Competibacteraceae bacterium]|nr:GNAT family N-acetyltransferase [Candidatus Competibacteraceae bacterium]
MELAIRHSEPSDAEAIRLIYASPNVVAGTLQVPYPSHELWRKRLSDLEPEARMLVAVADNAVVGHLGLHPAYRPRRAHAASLGMAVHDAWAGRGIGSALLQHALLLADNWLNLLRLELVVFADNEPAIRLYRKNGFTIEGTHRAFALRNGIFADACAMARLHPRPPSLP